MKQISDLARKTVDPVRVALKTLANFDSLRPRRAPNFPVGLMNLDRLALGSEPESTIRAWTEHRCAVTAAEAHNAGKLHMLLRSVRVLFEAGEEGDETAKDAARELMAKTLAAFPAYRERCRGKKPDLSEKTLRRECSVATRDYVALPKEWRDLRIVRVQQRRRRAF